MPTQPPSSPAPTATHCLECNTPLSPAEAQGLCARCLLKMGLASQFGETSVAGAGTRKLVPPPLFPFDFGGYRVSRMLGRGGMGVVYEAEDLATGRRIALKVLGQTLDSLEARQRFLREGRLAASINHPNSVYVYGTEEIDGTPVITMELVAGGTLHEQVKASGPLPVSAAVDAVLQVIPGLEAAYAAGILHRDIKPSNCFREAGGEVKIGDFGLSISTLSRGDSALTVSGEVLGTPEYASPEQLRGEPIDLRSDIYSVGMTLYYLLTGRTAFQAGNLVQLLATVLEKPAASPRTLRPEIPERLARVILRCVAKEPGDRYRTYAELREALYPFGSTAPTPATLGLRFVAGAADNLVFSVTSMAVTMLFFGGFSAAMEGRVANQPKWQWVSCGLLLFEFAYFAIGEGRWGTTLGKALLGLRVGGADRNAPGLARGALRSFIFLAPNLVSFLYLHRQFATMRPTPWMAAIGILISLYPALLAVTVRRRNGFATVVDLLSRTRVIHEPTGESREAVAPAEEPVAGSETLPKIGPYHILASLGADAESELLLGYDTRLMRRVWIRKAAPETAPLPASLRHATRPGHLRWLQGKREDGFAWDAYEAPSGVPLLSLLGQPQPWKKVRFWLLDLAAECAAARDDGSLPAQLSLDRVWITASGGAKLLDFRAPGSADFPEALPGEEAAAFLNQLAISALAGRIASAAEGRSAEPRRPIAIRARAFLRDLPTATDLTTATNQLRALVRQIPAISRLRRFGLVAGCTIPSLLMAGLMLIGLVTYEFWNQNNPDIMKLRMEMISYEQMRLGHSVQPGVDPATRVKAMEVYIAGRYGDLVRDPHTWSSSYALAILTADDQRRSTEIVARIGRPSAEDYAAARTLLHVPSDAEAAKAAARQAQFQHNQRIFYLFPCLSGFMWAAFLSVAAALACRGGVLMCALGIAVVTRHGADASRGRMLWRACIAWCWLPLAGYLAQKLTPLLGPVAALATVFLPLVAIVAWSSLTHGRTLQDRLAGTWLVPR